jgi:hypothetical protein
MRNKNNIEELTREELIELTEVFAKNWIAHDGSWFLSIEEKYGMDMAIEMDIEAWRKFTVVEAKRLKKFLSLEDNSGIEGLKKALAFRLYSSLNEDEIVKVADNVLEYRVKTCRVQQARRRKGLKDFPCKQVGIVEYSLFAKTIDDRFETEVVSCPPDITNKDYYCFWRFTLKK